MCPQRYSDLVSAPVIRLRGSVICLKFEHDLDSDVANTVWEGEATGWRRGMMVSESSDCSVCVWNLYSYPVEGEDGERGMATVAEMRGVL